MVLSGKVLRSGGKLEISGRIIIILDYYILFIVKGVEFFEVFLVVFFY